MRRAYRTALYTLIENAIDSSTSGDALFEATTPRTSRGRVSKKTVRVDAGPGRFNYGAESSNKAVDCIFTLQCWVTPDKDDEESLEEALNVAVEMAEELHEALHEDQSLGGAVCLADADEYDSEIVNLGATHRATAYLDGTINQTK